MFRPLCLLYAFFLACTKKTNGTGLFPCRFGFHFIPGLVAELNLMILPGGAGFFSSSFGGGSRFRYDLYKLNLIERVTLKQEKFLLFSRFNRCFAI
jgi:hypothetical protein